MLRVQNLILPPGGTPAQLRNEAARTLGVRPDRLLSCTPVRQSIDARKKGSVR